MAFRDATDRLPGGTPRRPPGRKATGWEDRKGLGGAILGVMTKSAVTRRHLPASPFRIPVAPPVENFEVGDRVTHDVYGLGRIIGVEDEVAVLADFGSRQVRIIKPYSKVTKL
ncbi:hypothetical protein M2266_006138 [Streptomyces sp. SPB162]|nr:hypothetical protein [Streptomyces sp. SPB162]